MIRSEFNVTDFLDVDWMRFAKLVIVEAILTPAHCDKSLVALAEIARERFSLGLKLLVMPLIFVLRISFIAKIAHKILQYRHESSILAWSNAKTDLGVENIYYLVQRIAESRNIH